tara:strand:- start:94 stop:420 length:327 start_codon:yes stop_codon:yes gene_type:complete
MKPRIITLSKQRLYVKQIRGRSTGVTEDDDVMNTLTALLEMIFDVGSKRYDEKKQLKRLDLSAQEGELNISNINEKNFNIHDDNAEGIESKQQTNNSDEAYTEHDNWM